MDTEYAVKLTANELAILWAMTEGCRPESGEVIDAVAGVRSKLRPHLEAITAVEEAPQTEPEPVAAGA